MKMRHLFLMQGNQVMRDEGSENAGKMCFFLDHKVVFYFPFATFQPFLLKMLVTRAIQYKVIAIFMLYSKSWMRFNDTNATAVNFQIRQ